MCVVSPLPTHTDAPLPGRGTHPRFGSLDLYVFGCASDWNRRCGRVDTGSFGFSEGQRAPVRPCGFGTSALEFLP